MTFPWLQLTFNLTLSFACPLLLSSWKSGKGMAGLETKIPFPDVDHFLFCSNCFLSPWMPTKNRTRMCFISRSWHYPQKVNTVLLCIVLYKIPSNGRQVKVCFVCNTGRYLKHCVVILYSLWFSFPENQFVFIFSQVLF